MDNTTNMTAQKIPMIAASLTVYLLPVDFSFSIWKSSFVLQRVSTILLAIQKIEMCIRDSLQAEYAKLLEEKKKTYAEYRRSREEMRELLTAKANVDRLLKMDEEQKKEQEKDHGQR